MSKVFNTTGSCNPNMHYMVDISNKLTQIKELIDAGAYFTINRARQYGKTTTLAAITRSFSNEYAIIYVDFQMIGNTKFATEHIFTKAFTKIFYNTVKRIGNDDIDYSALKEAVDSSQKYDDFAFDDLFPLLSQMCADSKKKIVVIIDEVDSATNNQVFLDFLAQLRAYYLARINHGIPTFQSVILAGVYDVKNIKRKIRPDEEHKINSPWNIATDFLIDMSFSPDDINGMLDEYEADNHTGMDTKMMSGLIYSYTSGYPFLVSKYCSLIDTIVSKSIGKNEAWTKEGFLQADKILLGEENTLFGSLTDKLNAYPELKDILYSILFTGENLLYNPDNDVYKLAAMFGFVKNNNGVLQIANRTFETRLYNYYMSFEQVNNATYKAANIDKNQFINDGVLDMDLVIQKFVEHFHDVYADKDEHFIEKHGRKFFLLYLKPIINGTGHYYIEAQTRDDTRTDVIVDYRGKQYVVELKIWRGKQYNASGEKQLAEYLDLFHLDTGYLLTFSFNKNKQIGIKKTECFGKTLIEATV